MRISLELELSLDQLADLFKERRWLYATEDCYGLPDQEALKAQLRRLSARIHESDDLAMVSSGRLALARNYLSNEDNNYEVLLSIGYLDVVEDEEAAGV